MLSLLLRCPRLSRPSPSLPLLRSLATLAEKARSDSTFTITDSSAMAGSGSISIPDYPSFSAACSGFFRTSIPQAWLAWLRRLRAGSCRSYPSSFGVGSCPFGCACWPALLSLFGPARFSSPISSSSQFIILPGPTIRLGHQESSLPPPKLLLAARTLSLAMVLTGCRKGLLTGTISNRQQTIRSCVSQTSLQDMCFMPEPTIIAQWPSLQVTQ